MREHATTVNGRATAPSATDVLAARIHVGLSDGATRAVTGEVAAAIVAWRDVTRRAGISLSEQDQVGVAFPALATVADLGAGASG